MRKRALFCSLLALLLSVGNGFSQEDKQLVLQKRTMLVIQKFVMSVGREMVKIVDEMQRLILDWETDEEKVKGKLSEAFAQSKLDIHGIDIVDLRGQRLAAAPPDWQDTWASDPEGHALLIKIKEDKRNVLRLREEEGEPPRYEAFITLMDHVDRAQQSNVVAVLHVVYEPQAIFSEMMKAELGANESAWLLLADASYFFASENPLSCSFIKSNSAAAAAREFWG